MHTVGSAAEARQCVDEGIDLIVAQGSEAGGHVWGQVSTMPLIPAVVDAVDPVPVIAAGGIADARGVAAALALGAAGVWMGTRFVATRESAAHPVYKNALLRAVEIDSVRTQLFDSGWPNAPHRVLRNSTTALAGPGAAGPSAGRPGAGEVIGRFPDGSPVHRYSDTEPLTGMDGHVEAMALYAGPSAALVHDVPPAADLVADLANRSREVLTGTLARLGATSSSAVRRDRAFPGTGPGGSSSNGPGRAAREGVRYQIRRDEMPESRASDPVGPANALEIPRFAGPDTFARLPRRDQVEHCEVAIAGVPFDSGVSFRPGARFGPAAVRAGSKLLRPYHPGLGVEPFAVQQVADAGDIACNPFDIREAIASVERGAEHVLTGAHRLVTIGGDHTIALPLLRVAHRRHGPVAVVHFDAHLDTWDTYFGAPFTHGTPFRRASEEGLIDKARSIHVGTRGGIYARTDLDDDREAGFQLIPAMDFEDIGVAGTADRIRQRAGGAPVYISVDIDVLDPAHAPGTGTPEAGGLSARELLGTLRRLAGLNIVGADVVEVAPSYDHAEVTAIAAAHVVYELISLWAWQRVSGDGA
jgi:agmatinase